MVFVTLSLSSTVYLKFWNSQYRIQSEFFFRGAGTLPLNPQKKKQPPYCMAVGRFLFFYYMYLSRFLGKMIEILIKY